MKPLLHAFKSKLLIFFWVATTSTNSMETGGIEEYKLAINSRGSSAQISNIFLRVDACSSMDLF